MEGCGRSIDRQCKSISYALNNNKGNERNVLQLHGSNESKIPYIVTKPLIMNASWTIKAQPNSDTIPVISTDGNASRCLFTFHHKENDKHQIKLTIESIELHNINILAIRKGKVAIHIKNCILNNSGFIDFSGIVNSKGNQQSSISVEISKSDINCSNSDLLTDNATRIRFDRVLIRSSTLTSCSIFLNYTRAHYPIQIKIEDTKIQRHRGKSSVVNIGAYSNVTLHNVNFINNEGIGNRKALFHLQLPLAQSQKSRITFNNITFQKNYKVGFVFLIENTQINGTKMEINNNINSEGIFIVNSTGYIGHVNVSGNKDFGVCFASDKSNYSLGKATIENNEQRRICVLIHTSNATIDSIMVKNTVFSIRVQAVFFAKSSTFVSVIELENITVGFAEAVGQRDGNLVIESLLVKQSSLHLAILQINGFIQILRGEIASNNNSLSSLIGGINSILFQMRSINVNNNVLGGSVFHIENVVQTNLRDITIVGNTIFAAFHLLKSNILIDSVVMANNIAMKHGKALTFTDEAKDYRIDYNVVIRNFHAQFSGFTGLYESDNYFEIDVRNSNVTISNSSVSVQDVFVPSIKVARLVFATKNPNIHPQLNVICPTNFNITAIPIVKASAIDYVISCQRCPKDRYSLLKGQIKLKGND